MGYCLNLVVTVARLTPRHRANESEVPINKHKAKACYKRESASYFKESYILIVIDMESQFIQ